MSLVFLPLFAALSSPLSAPSDWSGSGGEIRLVSARNGLTLRVDREALTVDVVRLDSPRVERQLRVSTTGFGRVGAVRSVGAGDPCIDGASVEITRPGIVERFEDRASGIEQSWTIASAPERTGAAELWIGITFTGLWPQTSEDGLAAKLVDEHGVQRLSYRGLHAFDATGRELPATMTSSRDGFGIRVDDLGAIYPITVDPTLGTADWFFEPLQAGARLFRASTAGDVDGDGYSDLLVAADLYDANGPGSNTGRVWLFRGSASGLSLTPFWESSGPPTLGQNGAEYGCQVCALGDIDADGYADFGVSAHQWDSVTNVDAGALFVYRGGMTGPTLHWTIEGNLASTLLSGPERYIGDLNGDGRDDIATMTETPGPLERVDVYLGSGNPTPGAPIWTLTKASLGWDVNALAAFQPGAAGDVDADGYEDLLIGAFSSFGGHGRALLFRGGASGPVSLTPTWIGIAPGAPAVDTYGLHVGSLGDVDGNGYADVFVAAFQYPGNSTGAVFIYNSNPAAHGSQLLPSTASVTLDGSGPNARFGIGCDTAGDFDGDGFPDLIVGQPPSTGGSGLAVVFRGSPSGLIPASTWQQFGYQLNDNYGTRTGSAGDVNGDGRTDVFVTAIEYGGVGGSIPFEGAIFVHHGRQAPTVVATPVHGATLVGTPTSGFGRSVAIGDVTGDGVADMIVGSPDYSGVATNAGRIALFKGHAINGFSVVPTSTHDWPIAGSRFGSAISICGDIGNDGCNEILVGAPGYTSGQTNEGLAVLFRGNAAGAIGTLTATYQIDIAGARFGSALAGAADVDGDRLADLVIGAPGDHLGQTERGAVYVYRGNSTGAPVSTPVLVLDGGQAGARFGAAVASAGDINRDGYTDIVVGSPSWTNGQGGEGRAWAYLGGPQGLNSTPDWFYEVNVSGAALGSAVASAGDVDRDGSADVIIGAPGYQNGATLGGSAFVFHGSPSGIPHLSVTPQSVLSEAQALAQHGAAVAFAGDINSDGFSDVVVGAPAFDASSGSLIDAGRVQLYLGSSSGIIPSYAWEREGTSASGNLGVWVAGGGDFDGDGFSDLSYGVPGTWNVYTSSGTTGSSFHHTTQQRRSDDLAAVSLLGSPEETTTLRLMGSSSSSQNLSSTIAGREQIRLEWEMKPLGSTLDGTGLERMVSFVATGSPSGTAPLLRQLVTGLQPGTPYQWRERIQIANPLFAHTRWLQIQGNGSRDVKFGSGQDCNGNSVPDVQDLHLGNSQDCDHDGTPDECEVPPLCPTCTDCDGNGSPDACDLFANDCDNNGVPDDCQTDCDGSSTPDVCDIAGNPALDTNLDGVIDSCQTNVTLFCFGDGSGTACPCGNVSVPADQEGCLHSLGTGGRLRSSGVPRVTADNFVLLGTRLPNNSALYFQATGQAGGGSGAVFGDGLRCASGSVIRLGLKVSSGGASQYPTAGNLSISVRGSIPAPGGVRNYQCWFRNSATFCTALTYNLTNGLRATWVP